MRRRVMDRLREHMAAQQRKLGICRRGRGCTGQIAPCGGSGVGFAIEADYSYSGLGHGNREHRVDVNYRIGRLVAGGLGGQCSCFRECD